MWFPTYNAWNARPSSVRVRHICFLDENLEFLFSENPRNRENSAAEAIKVELGTDSDAAKRCHYLISIRASPSSVDKVLVVNSQAGWHFFPGVSRFLVDPGMTFSLYKCRVPKGCKRRLFSRRGRKCGNVPSKWVQNNPFRYVSRTGDAPKLHF